MKKQSVFSRLLGNAKPYLPLFIGAALCAVVSVTFSLLVPVLIGKAIDYIVGFGKVDFTRVFNVLVVLACSILISALFLWLTSLFTNLAAYRTARDLRCQAFYKLSKVPLRVIDQNQHGDFINRIVNDIEQIADGLLQGFNRLLVGAVTIIGTLVFMFSTNVAIAMVVIFLTPLSLFAAGIIAKYSHSKFVEQTVLQSELTGYVEESFSGIKTIKAFSYEDDVKETFDNINGRLYNCGVKAQFYSALSNPSTRFVNNIVFAAVGVFGALSVINLSLSVGQLSCFLTYANHYTKPFNEITNVIPQIQTAFASARRIFMLLDEPDETPDPDNAVDIKNCTGNVELSDVYFSYNPETPLIKNLNLFVKSSNRIAIVGPTGCGKTTLINLLMRFYDTVSGTIKIDGTDIRGMTRGSLRGLYGMVLQDSWLYNATIRDNIAYGSPDATDDEVVAAAKSAHAHGFIRRLPNGYDTEITENGQNLSQGQRQLLCIARAMLVDPPMLILDEATSSIDTRTEQKIQKAFAEIMRGKTSFVVAHRLSTIREADVILVMKDGNIIEQGTHEYLLSKGGFYAGLYNSQFAPD